MLGDITVVDQIYIACGYTDMRNDGFVLLYKRLESGKFQWPRTEDELQPITWQQFRWLMEGLQVEQKHSIKPARKGAFY